MSAPLVRLEGARREEEEEDDRRGAVEDPPGVHDPAGEVVHVLEEVQVGERVAVRRVRHEIAEDADDEHAEDEDEPDDRRDDLVLREGRRERARGDEERPDERDPEVARGDRPPVQGPEPRQEDRVEDGREPEEEKEAPARRELPGDDGRLGDGRREERLDRARLALLREEAHGDDRRHEHHEDPVEDAREEERHERRARRLRLVQRQHDQVEGVALDEEERRQHDVGEGRDEVGEELPLHDRGEGLERAHWGASVPRAGVSVLESTPGCVSASEAASRETRRTKTSSRDACRGESSRSVQPRARTSRNTGSRRSLPAAPASETRVSPPAPMRAACVTPASWRRTASASETSPLRTTVT